MQGSKQSRERRADLDPEPAQVEDVGHPQEEDQAEDRDRLLLTRAAEGPISADTSARTTSNAAFGIEVCAPPRAEIRNRTQLLSEKPHRSCMLRMAMGAPTRIQSM
jgi:hypothetical protein